MVNAGTAGLTTRTVPKRPPCPLLSACPEVLNAPAAPSPTPGSTCSPSAAPCAFPPSCSPSLSPSNVSKSCLGSAHGVLPAGPGLWPSRLHVLGAWPKGQGPALLAQGHPPPRPYPADAGRLGLARVPGWLEPAITLSGGTAAGFGQRRGKSSVQKWLLPCPGPAVWYWQTGAQLVWLCPRKPWEDLPNTEVQTRLFSSKLWYPMRFQCTFLTWDNLLSLVLIYKWLLSRFKKKKK